MSEKFEKIINLNKEFQEVIMLESEKNYSLIQSFSIKYNKEVQKLPYRFNILSQFKVNENTHSALLQQLFSYKENGSFNALKSFLTFLNKEDDEFQFDCAQIINPKITVEQHRIDLLITEKGKYAIIIENKIHYAIEQKSQVERYIEKCKNLGFNESQIYILYLTGTGGEPSQYSFNKSRDTFVKEKRYLPISFYQHIYKWLKIYEPQIKNKEVVFKSAVIQYIDYLEVLLQLPNSYKEMNTQLNMFLKNKLELNNKSAIESLSIIDEKIAEISQLQTQLQNLKEENTINFFREWKEKIQSDFEDVQIVENFEKEKNYPNVGVLLSYKGKKFSILIEKEKDTIYYGFGKHFASDMLEEEITAFLTPIKNKVELKEGVWWYGYKYSTYEEIYEEFKSLFRLLEAELEL